MIRSIPNALTVARGLAGPAIVVLVVAFDAPTAAFAVFLAAIGTDLLDGWLARRLGAESRLGRALDPLADKALMISTWSTVGLVGWAPWWLVGPMLVRDIGVGVAWLAAGRPDVQATMAGRLKVSFEGVALPVLLFRHDWVGVAWPRVGVALGLFALVFATLSAVEAARALRARAPNATDDAPAAE